MAIALTPAHGWWALYCHDRATGDHTAHRITCFETDDHDRMALVWDGERLANFRALYNRTKAITLCYDPAAYDNPQADYPDHPWFKD